MLDVGFKFIRGDDNVLKTDECEVRDVWKGYYSNLLNVENPNIIEETAVVLGPVEEVTFNEVERALRGMKLGKAIGPSGLSADLLKAAGENIVPKLTVLFNEILSAGISPEEWTHSVTVPIYKGKGDPLMCSKYRGVRILEHGMRIWEKVLAGRLGALTNNHGFGLVSCLGNHPLTRYFASGMCKLSTRRKINFYSIYSLI